jgi:hypothetical protein
MTQRFRSDRVRSSLGQAEELERAAEASRLPEVAATLRRMAAELRGAPPRRRRIPARDTPDPFFGH